MFIISVLSKFLSRLFMTCAVLLWLAGCRGDQERVDLKYFDVRGFGKNQISQLSGTNSTLVKTLTINDKEEKQQITVANDSVFWQKEFKVFLEHDINKPVLRDAYQITQGKTENGQPFDHYQLKDTTKSGVISMQVIYNENRLGVRSWESEYYDDNVLYTNRRNVRMDLKKVGQDDYLQGYRIEGFHKLILKDSVHYQIIATLQY